MIWRFILIAFYCKTILLSTIVSTCARLELRYIMGISRRKIIIGKKKSSTMYTFSYFRKMASISPFFLCSSKRLSKWSSLTFGFAWLNFQGPNKPFKHKLKFPLEPWGQTLNYAAIDFHFYLFTSTPWKIGLFHEIFDMIRFYKDWRIEKTKNIGNHKWVSRTVAQANNHIPKI